MITEMSVFLVSLLSIQVSETVVEIPLTEVESQAWNSQEDYLAKQFSSETDHLVFVRPREIVVCQTKDIFQSEAKEIVDLTNESFNRFLMRGKSCLILLDGNEGEGVGYVFECDDLSTMRRIDNIDIESIDGPCAFGKSHFAIMTREGLIQWNLESSGEKSSVLHGLRSRNSGIAFSSTSEQIALWASGPGTELLIGEVLHLDELTDLARDFSGTPLDPDIFINDGIFLNNGTRFLGVGIQTYEPDSPNGKGILWDLSTREIVDEFEFEDRGLLDIEIVNDRLAYAIWRSSTEYLFGVIVIDLYDLTIKDRVDFELDDVPIHLQKLNSGIAVVFADGEIRKYVFR